MNDARPSKAPAGGRSGGAEKQKSALTGLRGLIPFVAPYKGVALGAGAALVVAAGATLAVGQAIRRMVDLGFSDTDPGFLDQYFAALMVVAVVLAAATFGRFYLVSWLGERVIADIRTKVYGHVIGLSPGFFDQTRTGEIQSRLTTDTTLIQSVIGSTVSVALRNILLLIGGSVLLAVTSLKLTLLVFVVVPLVVGPIILFGRQVRRLSRASQDRVAEVSTISGETLAAVRTVQAYTHEDIHRSEFGTAVEGAFSTAVRRIRARAWLTAIVIFCVFGSIDAVLWVGARDVTSTAMTGGALAAFVFYAIIVAGAVGALSEVYGDLQRAAGATERLMELLATQSLLPVPASPAALPQPPLGTIHMENVCFRYPARPDMPVLDNFSLSVAAGETIALVGPSGAGKSTVFQLLLRFYDPQSGAIRVDGVDITTAAPTDLRARMAIVEQEPVVFAATAAENIHYGRPGATQEAVRAAARAAAAEDFLDSFPDGFDTALGDRGVRLSGGQRQRIAIARAVLRDPAILLLDEATSALDSENERLVQAALEGLMKNRTTLVIAHRLSTVERADRIVVMDQGRVVAMGRHEALITQGGLYAHLASLQFANGPRPG